MRTFKQQLPFLTGQTNYGRPTLVQPDQYVSRSRGTLGVTISAAAGSLRNSSRSYSTGNTRILLGDTPADTPFPPDDEEWDSDDGNEEEVESVPAGRGRKPKQSAGEKAAAADQRFSSLRHSLFLGGIAAALPVIPLSPHCSRCNNALTHVGVSCVECNGVGSSRPSFIFCAACDETEHFERWHRRMCVWMPTGLVGQATYFRDPLRDGYSLHPNDFIRVEDLDTGGALVRRVIKRACCLHRRFRCASKDIQCNHYPLQLLTRPCVQRSRCPPTYANIAPCAETVSGTSACPGSTCLWRTCQANQRLRTL